VATLSFAPAAMSAFLRRLFEAAGCSPTCAATVVDHLIDASLVGLHSHGVLRVPDYLRFVAEGLVDPLAVPELVRDEGAVAVFDARRGFGQVAGAHLVDAVADRAAVAGLAVAAVRNAGHLGRIGAYVEALARRGFLAIGFCSVPTRFQNVAWYGTRTGRLGTNPIAYAFPTSGEPVVADFATSVIPEGKVRFLWNQGLPVPEGVLRDAAGMPTTDAGALYGDPAGTLQPLGSPLAGHKGSALGLLVEVLGTLLAGEEAGDPARANNLTLIALRPDPTFPSRADGLVQRVRAAVPIDPAAPPLLPGEPEARSRAEAGAVTVDTTTWNAVLDRARALGVEAPTA
jgi:uncharacterized oxidoreductase